MLECPLATPFETQWFTARDERYMRRMVLAVFLSIFVHMGVVAGYGLYHYLKPNVKTISVSSGTPDLPIRAQLVTVDSRAQSVEEPPKPVEKKEEVVITENKSETKIAVEEKPKEILVKQTAKKVEGNAPQNSIASATQENKSVGIHNNIPVYAEPRYRTPPQSPEYPLQARRRGQQGNVVLYVLVEANGRTSDVIVQRSSGYAVLDQAAERAVAKWQIIPYELNGVPQRAFYQVLVKFELK
jgi:protein TonB